MVQRRRSTLSFRPKTSHAAPDTPTLPRPPKRTQSQVFGGQDAESHQQACRDASPGKEVKLSHHTAALHPEPRLLRASTLQPEPRSRRASTLHDLEAAIQSVKDLVKRASTITTSKQHFLDVPLDTRTASVATMDDQPHSSSAGGAIRRWASTRKASMMSYRSPPPGRRPAVSGPANDKWNATPPPFLGASYVDLLSGGQSARESAASFNASGKAKRLSSVGHMSETDSVIGDDQGQVVSLPATAQKDKKRDFVSIMPIELSEAILKFLDAKSLVHAEAVSKTWQRVASSQHVWRAVFNAAFEPRIHVEPAPLQMGGVGAGLILPNQDWKAMYQARKAIERRWHAGKPAAIYLNGHTDSVYCCQFDEDKIITGSRDRTIRVWDLKTYQCLKVIGGPASIPQPNTPAPLGTEAHHTAPNGNLPSVNGTPEGRALYHQPAYYHEASILCLQFDHEIVVTGSSDNSCIVWDLSTWEPIWKLQRHDAGVLDVCFDSRYIVSCSKDNTICVWSRKTGKLIKQLTGHGGPVNAVQMRGDLLVSASGDGNAKVWDLKTMSFKKNLRTSDRGLAAVEFSDDAKHVLAGGNEQTVFNFDVESGNVVKRYAGHGGLVRSLFLDTPNKRVISGSYDQSIRVYNYESGEAIAVYENWTTSWILSAKSDYRRVVATSQDGRALLLDFGYGLPGVDILAGSRKARGLQGK